MTAEIEAYISRQPEKTQNALRELRAIVRSAAPGVTELIYYGIPAFALVQDGKKVKHIMIAGYTHHVGFYPHPDVIEKFKEELSGYAFAKGSVQFPLHTPLPKALIIKMVQYRLSEVAGSK